MVGILVSADLGVEVAFWSIFVCLGYDKVHLGHWVHVSGHEEVNVFPLKNALSFNEIGGSSCLVRGLLTSLNCSTLVSGVGSNSYRFLYF